ncbi:MAG TPA: MFS transporter [Victivallales bacterium]|nr:MFS transporter [Victivallales bacterium]
MPCFYSKLKILLTFCVMSILISGISTFIMQGVTYYHISYSSAGSLEGYFQITRMIFSFLIIGLLVKLGYRKSIMLALFLAGGYCFILPSFNSIWTLRMFLIVMGVIYAIIKISVYTSVTIVTKNRKEHASFINFIEACYMFAGTLGMWLFSIFIKMSPNNWINIFYLFSVMALSVGVLWFFGKFDESKVGFKTEKLGKQAGNFFKVIVIPSVLLFLIMLALYETVEQGMGSWLPNFFNNILTIPKFLSIEVASFLTLGIAFGRLTGSFVLRYIQWKNYFIFNLAVSVILITVVLLNIHPGSGINAHNLLQVPVIAYGLPLVGFFIGPIYPTLVSVVINTLKPDKHSIMASLIVIFSAIEVTASSKMIGIMYGHLGGIEAFAIATIIPITLLCLFIIYYYYKYREKSVF